MLETATLDTFRPHLNQTFHLKQEAAEPVALVLIQVTPLGVTPTDPAQRRAFSLVFREPGTDVRPQGVYSLAHPHLGTIDLFLVPIGPDSEGMRYEAVFA